MPTKRETPSFNPVSTDAEVNQNKPQGSINGFKERAEIRARVKARDLSSARRLYSFPDHDFLAGFLRSCQAEGSISSYDFITKAPLDGSDLEYINQPNDIGYQPEYLYQHSSNRLLHQLGPQYHRPEDMPEPEFIQYLSEQAANGDRRHAIDFYLNPHLDRQMSLFTDLISEMSAARLNFTAKTINRRREIKRLRDNPDLTIRTEGLVISAPSGGADKVLGVIVNNYQQSPDIFDGRPTPALAASLAPGIAVSTRLNLNTGNRVESFNFNRARLLDAAWQRVGGRGFLPADESLAARHIETFRRGLQEAAMAWKIDPDNLAFEKR